MLSTAVGWVNHVNCESGFLPRKKKHLGEKKQVKPNKNKLDNLSWYPGLKKDLHGRFTEPGGCVCWSYGVCWLVLCQLDTG